MKMKRRFQINFDHALCLLVLTGLLLGAGCREDGQTMGDIQVQATANPPSAVSSEIRMPTNSNPVTVTGEARRSEFQTSADKEMIDVVKQWYAAKNLEIPKDIMVRERNMNYWSVVANPGLPPEMWFEISPTTKQIFKAVGE